MKKLIRFKESRAVRLAASAVASATGIVAGRGNAAPLTKADNASHLPKAATFKHPRLKHGVLSRAGVRRLLFIGGGGSLLSPSRQRFVDSPDFPREYRGEARALEILGDADGGVEWSYASPPPVVEGERTGHHRVRAGDLPVTDRHGVSRITVPDYAAAIIDTLESGRFIGARFTVAY